MYSLSTTPLTLLPSPDLSRLVTYNPREKVIIISGLQQQRALILRDSVPTCLSWSPDSSHIALGFASSVVVMYRATYSFPRVSFGGEQAGGHVTSMDWSPDCRSVAVADSQGHIRLLPKGQNHQVKRLEHRHRCCCHLLAFSHDGGYLASASLDGTIVVWESTSGNPLCYWQCPIWVDELCWQEPHLLVKRGGKFIQAVAVRGS